MPLTIGVSFFLVGGNVSTAPQWTPATKRIILVICLILIGLAIWQFSIVLAPLVVAVIIAYLLHPLVNWLTIRTPLTRRWAATVVYIAFLLVILVLMPTLFVPLIIQQIRQLDIDVQKIVDQLEEAKDYQMIFAGFRFDLDALVEPITGSLDQIFSPLATWAANAAVQIAGGLIWAIFIVVVGFYLLLDANRLSAWLDSWIPSAYAAEFSQLRREIDGVWKAYFLGQVTLAIIVGLIIGVSTALLGIRSAFLLGVVAAILELIPNWGYGISGIVGVLFAYFQGSSWIPLPNWAFALLVAGFYFLMWQFDTNYLVPRIIGHRLQLAPALIIVGIIAGASVGGALGLLLAAPTIATVRVLGSYLYRRLLDIEPYVLIKKPAIPADEQKSLISKLPASTPPETESQS
jgi:predicted PurR-regulated permease PerM